MGFDRDFPMTRRQAKVLVVGLVVMGAFGAALFGGAIPGLKPNYSAPSIVVLEGEHYYISTAFLGMPIFPGNHTAPEEFPFHGVNFTLWETNWYEYTGGLIRGIGAEANHTVYPFVLGYSFALHLNSTVFISPDRIFAVEWLGGLLAGPVVHLLVHV